MLNLEAMYQRYGKEYKAGEVIFLEYEPGEDFYVIHKGRVKITKVVADTEKTLDILEEGDIFGEMAILEKAPRSASAIALSDTKLLKLNKANFDILIQSTPDLGLKILKVFCTRIYDAKRRLMILLLKEPNIRVADVFLMLAEKMGIDKTQKQAVEIMTTVQEVANWSGIHKDDCQKVISHYSKMGKINVFPDKIIINNINEFHRLVENKRKTVYDE